MKKIFLVAAAICISTVAFVSCQADEDENVLPTTKEQLLSKWYNQNNNMDSLQNVTDFLVKTGIETPGVKECVPQDILNEVLHHPTTLMTKVECIEYMTFSDKFIMTVERTDQWELFRHFFRDYAK